MSPGVQGEVRVQLPPTQLLPNEQEFPQRPQLLLSLMNDAELTQLPMHEVYPAAHPQEPPVQDCEIEQ